MEIKIQGSAKEIADLVVALQGQPKDSKLLEEAITLDGTSICRAVQETNSADPLKTVTNRMIQAIHDKGVKEQAKKRGDKDGNR